MRLLCLLLLLSISSTLTAQLQWVTNPANGHRYALTASMTWKQAEALAVSNGGHLVTIRSQAEQDWIVKTFVGSGMDIWMGLTDEAVEGIWIWTSGEPVIYTAWCSGEPNNTQGVEHYGHLSPVSKCLSRWNDFPNYPVIAGIIELSSPPATYSRYRQSCASSAGLPSLTNLTLPKIGTTLQLQITGLGSSKPGALLIGFNDQVWQAITLPFDLGVLGASSCALNIDPVISLTAFADSVGTATPVILIPNDPAHLGLKFYNQYVSLNDAPTSRPLKLSTTNAGMGVIGI